MKKNEIQVKKEELAMAKKASKTKLLNPNTQNFGAQACKRSKRIRDISISSVSISGAIIVVALVFCIIFAVMWAQQLVGDNLSKWASWLSGKLIKDWTLEDFEKVFAEWYSGSTEAQNYVKISVSLLVSGIFVAMVFSAVNLVDSRVYSTELLYGHKLQKKQYNNLWVISGMCIGMLALGAATIISISLASSINMSGATDNEKYFLVLLIRALVGLGFALFALVVVNVVFGTIQYNWTVKSIYNSKKSY